MFPIMYEVGQKILFKGKLHLIIAIRVDGLLLVPMVDIIHFDPKDGELEGVLVTGKDMTDVQQPSTPTS